MVEKIGIVGGGQLGMMLTEAASPLGFKVFVLEKEPVCPAAQVGARQIVGNIMDPAAIRELAEQVDVISWEVEHIGSDTLIDLASEGFNVQPSPYSLAVIKDKFEQKNMLRRRGLPVPNLIALREFINPTDKAERLRTVKALLGGEIILKARTGGFDGRGNLVYRDDPDAVDEKFGDSWDDVFAERIEDFDKELSVVLARDIHGSVSLYPPVETVHRDNICHTVVAPADISPQVRVAAEDIAHETMKLFRGAGVFAIEMFLRGDDILINEIAPRVHNSGHHTIEANVTSQFAQHIRAISGMPLGSTAMRSPAAAMINILGRKDLDKREEPLSRGGLDILISMGRQFGRPERLGTLPFLVIRGKKQ
jgi:phosphoribosylaminoimidazole carboxylase PurK protein